jgi:hypothetical protein
MANRSARDDYAMMMSLLPEGNRQILAAIGAGLRRLMRRLKQGIGRSRDRNHADRISYRP